MADDSNSWDNAINEILNSSADDVPVGGADPTVAPQQSDGVTSKPTKSELFNEERVTAASAIESPSTAPATRALAPSLFSSDSLSFPNADASPNGRESQGRPSLFGNTNSLFGDSPKPTPESLFASNTAAETKHAHESDDNEDDDNNNDVLDLLDSPSAPAKLSTFPLPSSKTATAPHFSGTLPSPANANPATSSPPKPVASAADADDNDPPLPDFLSMISGTLRGAGSGGMGTDGNDARARRRRLLNLAQGQLGPASSGSGSANEQSIGDVKQQTPGADPLAALLGGSKSPVLVTKAVGAMNEAPQGMLITNPASEQQIPRDPLAGLLKAPRQRASGGTATTLGTLSDQAPTQASNAHDQGFALTAAPEASAFTSPPALSFLQPKPPQLATRDGKSNSSALLRPTPSQVTQHSQIKPQQVPSDATHTSLLAHIHSLESQLTALTAHNSALQSDLTSLRTLLTSTQTQLSNTQAKLAQATTESTSLLRSAHDQLATAASAVTQRDQDALAMHLSAARELDARSKQVGERQDAVEREWLRAKEEREACRMERERVAGLAEDAGKVLAKALAREAEVGEWVRDEMARVKAERAAVVEMRQAVETELSAQRAEVMAMRERVEVARAKLTKQVEEDRRALTMERSEVSKLRAQTEEEQASVKKWKGDIERGVAEAAKALELEASELARKSERVARDEAKVGVLMHKVQVAESRISVEREAVEDRAREVVRLLEDARGVYARAVAERREAARMHREADEWRRNGREGFDEEREKVKREWERVKEERKRIEVQVAELARRAVAQDPLASKEAWVAPTHQHQCPPSPVSPGQSAVNGEDIDATMLEDCRPNVQYIPRRFHPAPSGISFDSMISL